MNYPKLIKGYSIRGADLGRSNIILDNKAKMKFYLYILTLDRGGYDQEGAYWGHANNGTRIYRVVGYTDNGKLQEMFIWAKSRIDAKCQVCEVFSNAKFYK